jgi:monothiol glutaredoxin
MDANVKERIDRDVKSNRVFLYMKGTPAFPQCGFSHRAVQILRHYGVDFGSANVLEDTSIREGIKEYSNWPTIPQLYVEGEFVGGCDIMMELHERGELASVLKQTTGASETAS